MFCPKCGTQNADRTRFCRGCGAELGAVLVPAPAMVAKRTEAVDDRALTVKHIELFSLGLRGLMIGGGFTLVSAIAFAVSTRSLAFALFALIPAVIFLSVGASRLIQAKGLKALIGRDEPAVLPGGQTEYIKPLRSVFDTDDLSPISVTENTTRHLELDAPDEAVRSAKQ